MTPSKVKIIVTGNIWSQKILCNIDMLTVMSETFYRSNIIKGNIRLFNLSMLYVGIYAEFKDKHIIFYFNTSVLVDVIFKGLADGCFYLSCWTKVYDKSPHDYSGDNQRTFCHAVVR